MSWFFKTFGKGILYFISLPIIIIVLSIYGIYLFFYFLYMSIKGMILFFKGKSLKLKTDEDKLADEIIKSNLEHGPISQETPSNNLTINYNNINLNPSINKENIIQENTNNVIETKEEIQNAIILNEEIKDEH